jgi:hypothetical protein
MRRPGFTHTVGAAAALLVVLLGPLSAWAHEAGAPVTSGAISSGWAARPGDADLGGLLIAAVALGIRFGLRRPRRLVPGLVILLAVFAFEEALHSAHHLRDPLQAAACKVAVATAHLAASPLDAVDVHPIITPPLHPLLSTQPTAVALRRPAPHEGRAPPAASI